MMLQRNDQRALVRLVVLTAAGAALASCGSTTKTIITIEKPAQTVTVRAITTPPITATTAVTTPQTTATPNVTKCGPNTTACPVVVNCPIAAGGGPSLSGCYGVVGVSGNVTRPSPGPDRTGLGLNCPWSRPALNAEHTIYVYICDPGP